MKKVIVMLAVISLVFAGLTSGASAGEVAPGRAGVGGFFVGCCLGLRTGAAWNDGKDLHWREYVRFVPYVNYIFGIWDGIECAQGITTEDIQSRYGATFY